MAGKKFNHASENWEKHGRCHRSLSLEVLRYHVDGTVKNFEEGDRIEHWWGTVIDKDKYPAISRMVSLPQLLPWANGNGGVII